jgi:hypothetical protein
VVRRSDDNGLLGAAEPIDLLFELGDLLLSLGQGTWRIRDAIDLPFNQHISVLRPRHAHHRGVQGKLALVNCLGGPRSSFIPATRGDLSGRPAALAGKGSTEGGTEGFARPVPSCGPVCRTGIGVRRQRSVTDRREIWRMMDQLTGVPDVQGVLQDYPVKAWIL